MTKHISPGYMYNFPSGITVHPCRLIQRDGTLMWKHALLHQGELALPATAAHEQHIVKTAQRLEELNSWVSRAFDLWKCLVPIHWYSPTSDELSTGYSVYFKHAVYDNEHTYDCLAAHILPHETLSICENFLLFKRC